MTIKFGRSRLGPVNEAVETLEKYHKLGLKACEIGFNYSVYIKEHQTAEIKKAAEKFGIRLSIHSHYWVNLNSEDPIKVENSKKRILECCRIGELLGAKIVVFHPGYYGKMSKEDTYKNIANAILDMQREIKKNNWKIKLAAETMGKVNVFGSIKEIKSLVKDTGCTFCIDFAHLLARSNGKMSYKEMMEEFKEFDDWHCHFSGIIYGDKGEKKHKPTPEEEWEKLLKALPKNKNITIINESPNSLEDSVMGLKILEKS